MQKNSTAICKFNVKMFGSDIKSFHELLHYISMDNFQYKKGINLNNYTKFSFQHGCL